MLLGVKYYFLSCRLAKSVVEYFETSFKFEERSLMILKFRLHCLEKKITLAQRKFKTEPAAWCLFLLHRKLLYKSRILDCCSFFLMQVLQLF